MLVSPCHRANAAALSGRTHVCVTMLTLVAASLLSRPEFREKTIGREWQMGKTHTSGIGQRIRDSRRHRIDAALTLGLRTKRPDQVDRVGKEDVGMRRVGKGGDAAVAQLRIDHVPFVVMHHVLDQRPAIAHCNGAIELAAALHRVDRPADIGRMHAVQHTDFAGHAMHGKSHPLDVEGDRARREIGPAADREAVVDLRAGSMKLAERHPLVAADDTVVVEAALGIGHVGVATGKLHDVLRHRLGHQVNRLASHHDARAREGAGVIGREIGIGVDDVDIADACPASRRRSAYAPSSFRCPFQSSRRRDDRCRPAGGASRRPSDARSADRIPAWRAQHPCPPPSPHLPAS